MPVTLSYPGVYIEEVPSGVRTITGVATSITAFIGRALRGPVNEPVRVHSFGEFERRFGGLWRDSTLCFAVQQFFQNGGTDALIVRVHNGARPPPRLTLAAGFNLVAANPGDWGEPLRVRIDHNTRPHLPRRSGQQPVQSAVRDTGTGVTERFLNLSTDPNNARFVSAGSGTGIQSGAHRHPARHGACAASHRARQSALGADPCWTTPPSTAFAATWQCRRPPHHNSIPGVAEAAKAGPMGTGECRSVQPAVHPAVHSRPRRRRESQTRSAAASYCQQRRAMYVVDPLMAWDEPADLTGVSGLDSVGWGLARTKMRRCISPICASPILCRTTAWLTLRPCGAVAGVMARTDGQRGVWKAPAGTTPRLTAWSS